MNDIQRMKYSEGQFLHAQDFEDQQKYHQDIMKLHNKTFHGWGIIEGLQVVKENQGIFVLPGKALDKKGRLIVISQKKQITFSFTKAQVYLRLQINDELNDDKTRITETAEIVPLLVEEFLPNQYLTLAKLTFDGNEQVTEIDTKDNCYSCMVVPVLSFSAPPEAKSWPVNPKDWPKITGKYDEDFRDYRLYIDTSITEFRNNVKVNGKIQTNGVHVNGTLKIGDTINIDESLKKIKITGNLEINDTLSAPGAMTISSVDNITFHIRDGKILQVLGNLVANNITLSNQGFLKKDGTSKSWPDFVFSEEYSLMPIDDLQDYVQEHHRLPGIPSEQEISEKGMNIAEMQVKTLQKIEELTLYSIEQNNRNKKLEKQVESLQQENTLLRDELQELKQQMQEFLSMVK